ncbi:AcrR family transcriptional regulator [Endobacter medicaginis]|uniref:AcrR family transcriptional regulator n=1 Tax=Endobacter medicaginis TaxID=1181271 RepID=A0A850NS27_9PROT|nr:TetR/AcrR family transcriptional regulator [Endobacter medicaginis]MBB3175514.1 AcrR family transcriptional regulator [Endobacter medicaginis]MCX5477160.1 TetR/AcrR family transcriptional regulator [Endobacter medicaginis]NVN30192.1 TetR/AcrR family transcriptional regulator [Endobacter medicaginis]
MEKRYHHGDLRAALIEVGLRLLAERDVEGVSLREMAREIGVSATSVYRHFPEKAALMQALAREGLDRLAIAQQEAASGKEGAASFAATGRAYVRFALTNPAIFRLIFTSSAQLQATGEIEALRMLRANAAAASSGGDVGPEQAENGALRAWSLVHGLAMLMLDGQLPADDRLIDALIQG